MLGNSEVVSKQLARQLFWKYYGISFFILFFVLIMLPGSTLMAALIAWPTAKLWASSAAHKGFAVLSLLQSMVRGLLLGTPEAPRYFSMDVSNSPCGISVDTKLGSLTTVTWEGPLTKERVRNPSPDCFKVQTFGVEEILRWQSIEPGATVHEIVGSLANARTEDILAMNRKNAQAQRQQRNGTGLLLETDRLDAQEVFLNINYVDAKQWVLLLKKFSDKTLSAVSEATPFPKS